MSSSKDRLAIAWNMHACKHIWPIKCWRAGWVSCASTRMSYLELIYKMQNKNFELIKTSSTMVIKDYLSWGYTIVTQTREHIRWKPLFDGGMQ